MSSESGLPASPALHITSRILAAPVLLGQASVGILMFLLPVYTREMHFSAVEIGSLFSAFSITALVGRPLVGWGIDRMGRKPFFVGALLVYGVALAVLAAANKLWLMALGRAIQGIASSLMWISVYTIAADLAPANQRGGSVAVVDGAAAQGALFGTLPGFALALFLPLSSAWPLMFTIYAVAALAAAGLAWRSVPETRPAAAPAGEQKVTLAPALTRLMVIVFFTGLTSAMVAPIWLVFLQDNFTQSIQTIAFAYLPSALVYSFLPPLLGRLSDRFGRVPLMALGLVIAGLVSLCLPALTGFPNGILLLAGLWIIEALGFVMAGPAQEALVADLTGLNMRGRAYGLYTLAAGVGAAIGPLMCGWLYDRASQAAPFYLNGLVMLASAGLVLLLLGRQSKITT